MSTEELLARKQEIEQKLLDPNVLSNQREIQALSIELGKIEKNLASAESAGTGHRGNTGRESVVVEVRAGAGGEEAALFARKLFGMYTAYAKKRGWAITIIDSNQTSLGGYREAVFEVSGPGAHQELRQEAGVHRVQRIPETEKMGRVHTSTASVAVLEKAEESDMTINPQDIKVEFFRSSGPGGQNVNKVETAVRIYHLPSGLVVGSQESRSQQKNREYAMMLLRTKLLDAERDAAAQKAGQARREQIGNADRAEKIRTYNFPQDRITDHRIKTSWHNIPSVLAGNMEPIVEAFKDKKKESN